MESVKPGILHIFIKILPNVALNVFQLGISHDSPIQTSHSDL